MRNQRLIGACILCIGERPLNPIPAGTTMGSQKDLLDATEFIKLHGIKPIVSVILESFEDSEKGFDLMQKGDQFGKIVMKVQRNSSRL